MKNKFIKLITIFCLSFGNSFAENILIEAKKISLDKKNQTTIFEEDVNVLTLQGNNIKSDYATYNKIEGVIKLKKNIIATDKENNVIYSKMLNIIKRLIF